MMQTTGELTSRQWQVADAIAYQLVIEDVDVNEFRKTISYLRMYGDREEAGVHFFKYLNSLAKYGDRIGHSKRTQGYLATIAEICQKHLNNYQDDALTLLQVLGWAARLMLYYKEVPIGELSEMEVSEIPSEAQLERDAKMKQLVESETLEVGQELEAVILQKKAKGSEVKYEIAGITFNEKEKKRFQEIPESGSAIVEIKSLKEDGSIAHVKFVRPC